MDIGLALVRTAREFHRRKIHTKRRRHPLMQRSSKNATTLGASRSCGVIGARFRGDICRMGRLDHPTVPVDDFRSSHLLACRHCLPSWKLTLAAEACPTRSTGPYLIVTGWLRMESTLTLMSERITCESEKTAGCTVRCREFGPPDSLTPITRTPTNLTIV